MSYVRHERRPRRSSRKRQSARFVDGFMEPQPVEPRRRSDVLSLRPARPCAANGHSQNLRRQPRHAPSRVKMSREASASSSGSANRLTLDKIVRVMLEGGEHPLGFIDYSDRMTLAKARPRMRAEVDGLPAQFSFLYHGVAFSAAQEARSFVRDFDVLVIRPKKPAAPAPSGRRAQHPRARRPRGPHR